MARIKLAHEQVLQRLKNIPHNNKKILALDEFRNEIYNLLSSSIVHLAIVLQVIPVDILLAIIDWLEQPE